MSGARLFKSWLSDDGEAGVFVEETATCCYAYFMRGESIVGDVWLYNVGPTPTSPPWLEPDARLNIPFANPMAFCNQLGFDANVDLVEVDCVFDPEANPKTARILIRGIRHAVVGAGLKPGHCRLATADGPLALIMACGS